MTFRILLRLRAFLESTLWGGRWVVVFAVITSAILSVSVLVVSLVDSYGVLKHLFHYRAGLVLVRQEIIAGVIEVVDGFLLSAMLLIFAIGLYSIFIGTMNTIPKARKLLVIETLDDLKSRISKTILLIMFVKVFGVVMKAPASSTQDVLYIGCGMVLAAASVRLLNGAHSANSNVSTSNISDKAPPSTTG